MMTTRELIDKYGISANKSLGQNFLHREDIIESIADAAAGPDCALEIGAGLGVLSRSLCTRFKKVITVEIDKSLERVTGETLAGVSNHTLLYADFLKLDLENLFEEGTKIALVGNLPYNITGDILAKLFKNHAMFEKAVIMIQKEAAQKLISPPGTKQYRAISVYARYFCDVTPLFDVSADSFIPAPHVTSTVVKLDFKKDLPVPRENEREFMAFVNRVFCQRRKLLTSIFHDPAEKESAIIAMSELEIPENIRGERLSPVDFAALFNKINCK